MVKINRTHDHINEDGVIDLAREKKQFLSFLIDQTHHLTDEDHSIDLGTGKVNCLSFQIDVTHQRIERDGLTDQKGEKNQIFDHSNQFKLPCDRCRPSDRSETREKLTVRHCESMKLTIRSK